MAYPLVTAWGKLSTAGRILTGRARRCWISFLRALPDLAPDLDTGFLMDGTQSII